MKRDLFYRGYIIMYQTEQSIACIRSHVGFEYFDSLADAKSAIDRRMEDHFKAMAEIRARNAAREEES